MRIFVLAAASMLAAPAGATTIEVGKANWSSMPRLAKAPRQLSYEKMVDNVERLLKERSCSFDGQRPNRFDIIVPYAVFLEPDGKASRVLVADMGCEPLETMVGNLVADLSALGDYKPSAADKARWYASTINFTLR
jgi:hypothetical protein